jgi:hypothetical protein
MDEFKEQANVLNFKIFNIEPPFLYWPTNYIPGYLTLPSRCYGLPSPKVATPSFIYFIIKPFLGLDTS